MALADEVQALLEATGRGPEAVVEATRHRPDLLATIRALGQRAEPAAAGALLAISEAPLEKGLRKEAARALHRLRTKGVEAPAAAPRTRQPVPATTPVYETWATPPDPAGSRHVLLLATRSQPGIWAGELVLNDATGVRQAAFYVTSRRRSRDLLEKLRKEDPGWLQLPVAYTGALIGEAAALNERLGTPLPEELLRHQDVLQGLQRPFVGALVYDAIAPGSVRLAPDWLRTSPALLDEPELLRWAVQEDVAMRLAEDWRRATGRTVVVTPRGREEVLAQAARESLGPEARARLKRRLEEVAYHFLRTDRRRQAEQAVAAAVALEETGSSSLLLPGTPRRIEEHPLVRELVERSLELAVYVKERRAEETDAG